jgi:AcrR family transcriptional regulator
MPKLSEQLWNARRRHVLVSAFRCFARDGFHATTIDDVVAESGWSSSVVYRYVRGKDELIAASVDESLSEVGRVIDGLVAQVPAPTPQQSVQAIIDLLDDTKHERSYHLAALVIQTWAEALRSPELGETARAAWARNRKQLSVLAGRWKQEGYLPEAMEASDAAAMLALMISGIVVDETHLGGESARGALRRMRMFAGPS